MKKILAFIPLFCLFTTIQAQKRFDATLSVGANMCQIDGDSDGGYKHLGLRTGIGTSFTLTNDINDPWRIVLDIAFTNKGSYVNSIDRYISVNYVELPVMLSYNMLNNRLRIAVGVAPAILVGAKVTDGGVDNQPQMDNFKQFDWLPITISIRYRLFDHIGIETRYQDSMLPITKENAAGTFRIFRDSNKGSFNRLISFGLTYQF